MAKVAQYHVSRSAVTGKPSVTVVLPEQADLKDMVRAQELLFTNVFEKLGLAACGGCRSGLDAIVWHGDDLRGVVLQPVIATQMIEERL